jgi:hypothetical protein
MGVLPTFFAIQDKASMQKSMEKNYPNKYTKFKQTKKE